MPLTGVALVKREQRVYLARRHTWYGLWKLTVVTTATSGRPVTIARGGRVRIEGEFFATLDRFTRNGWSEVQPAGRAKASS
jgi:hypothetical protein